MFHQPVLYAYVGNDPLDKTDPAGTEVWIYECIFPMKSR
jgi:hypothetical protein